MGADNLRVYRDPDASVVILEHEVHGASAQAGWRCNNRFVPIVTASRESEGSRCRFTVELADTPDNTSWETEICWPVP